MSTGVSSRSLRRAATSMRADSPEPTTRAAAIILAVLLGLVRGWLERSTVPVGTSVL